MKDFIIAASDVSGQITLIRKIDEGSIDGQSCTFGAHLDLKDAPINIRRLITLPITKELVSVGEAPLLRLWDKNV